MKKAIYLQAQGQLSGNSAPGDVLKTQLPAAFAQANPGMALAIKNLTGPDASGNLNLKVFIQGEQDPAADFAAVSTTALQKALAALPANKNSASSLTLKNIQEVEGDDEDDGLVLPPQQAPTQNASAQNAAPPQALAPQNAPLPPVAAPPPAEKAAPQPPSKVPPFRRRKHR